jgi:ABC-type phosphate transport system substrate-binding protein
MGTLHRFFFTALILPALAWADIAVIVNKNNQVVQLTRQQVSDLYLGRSRIFPNGEYALVFDLPRDANLRRRFFSKIANMTQQQLNSYWSRLMFTGQVLPPQVIPDERTVLELVRRNPGAMGYISAESLDATVRVVLTLKD